MLRFLDARRTGLVIIENVPRLLSRYREVVDHDLMSRGYGVRWVKIKASDVGAPHRRSRVFVVAALWWGGSLVLDGSTGNVGDLWPTPTASNPNDGEAIESWMARRARVAKYSRPISPPLGIAAQLWPTPLAADAKHVKTQGPGQPSLGAAAGCWPTPTCGDAKSSGSRSLDSSKAHSGTSLTDAVRPDRTKAGCWPTPTARDWRTGSGTNRQGSDPLPVQAGGKLNPNWVEQLMGFPVGWTDPSKMIAVSTPRDTPNPYPTQPKQWPMGRDRELNGASPQHEWEVPRLMPSKPRVMGRPARLRALGNAVVPQQGQHAITLALTSHVR
jgi:DNA (cytosine-5)-methyltransferase 1